VTPSSRTRARGCARAAAAFFVVAGVVAPAQAYVRSTTKADVPTAWATAEVALQLYVGNPPEFLDRATLVRAVTASAATWSKPAAPCTDLVLSVTEREEAEVNAEYDGVNRIGFRRDEWRKMPCDPAKELCAPYNALAIAITTVTSNTRTGEILDADMELNAVRNKFGDIALDGAKFGGVPNLQDLQNTMTHELGHLIGLDHNCYDPNANLRGVPKDDKGNAAPACATAGGVIPEATMFSRAGEREIKKRDLSEDDIRAVCEIYPVGYRGLPGANLSDKEGGCAFGRTAAQTPWTVGLLFALGFIGRAWIKARGGR
jgi:hypothetical protein